MHSLIFQGLEVGEEKCRQIKNQVLMLGEKWEYIRPVNILFTNGYLLKIIERIAQVVENLIAQFWSLGKDLHEEGKFKSALTQLLRDFRKTLDDSSPLAISIDNNNSSREMAIIANKEGYPQLGEILFLDTEEGDQRQEERRDILRRMNEDRRQSSTDISPDNRQSDRRTEKRRDAVNERRGEWTS